MTARVLRDAHGKLTRGEASPAGSAEALRFVAGAVLLTAACLDDITAASAKRRAADVLRRASDLLGSTAVALAGVTERGKAWGGP